MLRAVSRLRPAALPVARRAFRAGARVPNSVGAPITRRGVAPTRPLRVRRQAGAGRHGRVGEHADHHLED
eukprot:2691543-Prymnesium_polylepis.2